MRLWHILLFVLVLGVTAVAFAPMRVFLPQKPDGLSYGSVDGTIWQAKFDDARLGNLALGAADWRMSLRELLQNRLVADVSLSGGSLQGDLRVLANRRGDRRLGAAVLEMKGAPIGPLAALPGGKTVLRDVDVMFIDGRCQGATGTAVSDVLAVNRTLLAGFGPALSGVLRCDGDAAELKLEGQDSGARLSVRLLFRPDGAGEWRAVVEGARPEVAAALGAMGFNMTGEVSAGGELRWLAF